MIIDLGSFTHDEKTLVQGGTPGWSTALCNQTGTYPLYEDNKSADIIRGMLSNAVDIQKVSYPFSRPGGHDIILAGHFTKVSVNGNIIPNSEYTLVVSKELAGVHAGRKSLRYSPKTTYNGIGYNINCYNQIADSLGIPNGSWLITEINVINQNQLDFVAYVLDANGPKTYANNNDRNADFRRLAIQRPGYDIESRNKGRNVVQPDLVVVNDMKDNYTHHDLVAILEEMKRSGVPYISHIFGFKYGKYCLEHNVDIKQVVIDAGISDKTASAEPQKGRGIAEAIFNNKFGMMFYSPNKKYISNNYSSFNTNLPLQQIWYGAPGTGKSRAVKMETGELDETGKEHEMPNVFRTTFHPDYDYSSFIGAYKPTEKGTQLKQTICDFGTSQAISIPVKDANGKDVLDNSITYRFVPQVFVNAYVRAWNLLSTAATSNVTSSTSSLLSLPTFTPTSCYMGRCGHGTPAEDFAYTSEGASLNDAEKELLAKVDAFLIDQKSIFGDLHDNNNKVKVVVTNITPEERTKTVTYHKEDIQNKLDELDWLIRSEQRSSISLLSLRKHLQDILDKMNPNVNEITITYTDTILGEYKQDIETVYLYKNNIGNNTNLLVSTYIHEMFHAYFDKSVYVEEVEEAIVEGSTLIFLEQFDNRICGSYRNSVLNKCNTPFSYYGFGVELYERCSEDWIKDFMDVPLLDKNNALVKRFCDYFALVYPFDKVEAAVADLYNILKNPVTYSGAKTSVDSENSVVLVIEEINRGNCAQIFGDIFQLLDRKDNGFSEYPVNADEDLRHYLETAKDDNGNDILQNKDGIKGGKICLPPNLYIWATMNTSDQSLFPMDSAFKRRWDWEYVPIEEGKGDDKTTPLGWKIKLDENHELIDWWTFLERINRVVADLTTSEDKQLGYFFCKPDEETENGEKTIISAKRFVNKVIFYLWNDVFKDYAFDVDCCKDSNKKEVLFYKFFNKNSNTINIDTLKQFFETLKTDKEDPLVLEKQNQNTPVTPTV